MELNSNKRRRTQSYESDSDTYDNFDIMWGSANQKDSQKGSSCENKSDMDDLTENKLIYTIGNEIHFTAGINKNSIQQIIKQITTIIHNHKNRSVGEPEKLNIVYIVDSPGGSVTSILKFVDFIDIVKKKNPFVHFTSIISGMAASAGTVMAVVADTRYMTKNAHTMVHELTSGMNSKFTEMKSYLKFLQDLHDRMVDIYHEKTGKPKEDIERIMRSETWFTASEYLANGFVDEIK